MNGLVSILACALLSVGAGIVIAAVVNQTAGIGAGLFVAGLVVYAESWAAETSAKPTKRSPR